ncbi:Calcium homeostasis endoplasmic reticulum protein [Madurella mycetomatis]|uniref:Calcium homeostasis endoplasmic reticulum protein n=1 Tax=Madurella mycetomatis TaxID=100816 RepID=A0A175VSZ9_9PEZI|nr:Calcium homeostasis endoplasmic reticulum protein [Madurella mycetomatis]
MNTVKSFWTGWGALCVAGAGAYYFAKKQINADRLSRLEEQRKKKSMMDSLEYSQNVPSRPLSSATMGGSDAAAANGGPARTDMNAVHNGPNRAPPLLGSRLVAMASAELIVAKTALSGALFRPDPRPCSRDDIEFMLALLNSTIAECSPPNVQRCKQWALSNLVPSSTRTGPFCKYLAALARSFGGEKDAVALQSKGGRLPSAKRRRLHVLYILSDILYHVKHRNRDESFAQKLEPTLPALVRSAASFHNCPKHIRKIHSLIELWNENKYFSQSFIQKLQSVVDEGPASGEEGQNGNEVGNSASGVAKTAKAAPFVMPAMHGDPSAPWYDLPAGNWLPVLEPNNTRPMSPAMIKPLVLAQGPADKSLVEAVKKLLLDVDKLYSKEASLDEPRPNIGRLGERVEIDEITGEIIGGDTYYGWSRAFCEKMKARKRDRTRRSNTRHGDDEEKRESITELASGPQRSLQPQPWPTRLQAPEAIKVAGGSTQKPQLPAVAKPYPVPVSFAIKIQVPRPKPRVPAAESGLQSARKIPVEESQLLSLTVQEPVLESDAVSACPHWRTASPSTEWLCTSKPSCRLEPTAPTASSSTANGVPHTPHATASSGFPRRLPSSPASPSELLGAMAAGAATSSSGSRPTECISQLGWRMGTACAATAATAPGAPERVSSAGAGGWRLSRWRVRPGREMVNGLEGRSLARALPN